MKLLVTGAAGFIGSHTCELLLDLGHQVVALDNFDSFYPKARKRRNVETALKNEKYKLVEGDFGDRLAVSKLLETEKFDVVLHLAAQAGVRQSIHDPLKYERTNVRNLIAMLEAMRDHGPHKIVAASSSSVYGNATPVPFREDAPCMHMLSPYAASKRAAEIFLGTYAGLYDFKITVVRPFTVYGPRQRPDMAISSFAEKLLMNEPITLFGDGTSSRDYTYVGDLAAGLAAAVEKVDASYTVYNLGGESPVSLNDLIAKLEAIIGRKAQIQRMEMPKGDVERTAADISKARKELGFAPKVSLQEGLEKTVAWVKRELRIEVR
jgi:UDP-glucuronate 4-epimerase